MIVIDTESTGVDPQKNSLLSIGAVDFENPADQFYGECRIFDGAHVEKEALRVNGFTKDQINDPKKKTDRELVSEFLAWAGYCGEHTFAGQNSSFDRDFVQYTCHRYHIEWNWPLAHRVVDLHSVCYFHMRDRGITPPVKHRHSDLNLETILAYVGVNVRRGSHNALEDAKLEAEAFSRLLSGKALFKEYAGFSVPPLKK